MDNKGMETNRKQLEAALRAANIQQANGAKNSNQITALENQIDRMKRSA